MLKQMVSTRSLATTIPTIIPTTIPTAIPKHSKEGMMT